ncbi:MAG: hypothetical protein F4W92_08900 [Gammaproteobacteria bacterium]|nr:hypothetical protein [Gammaproteobacteria bacterium]
MKGKINIDSIRRAFSPYTVFLLVMFLVLLSLWIAAKYYRYQAHQQEHFTFSLDETGLTIQISRFKLEMQVLETRTLIDNELELIENSKQSLITAHLIDKTEWTTRKDELLRLLDYLVLKSTDRLYLDIESAVADIEEILSS